MEAGSYIRLLKTTYGYRPGFYQVTNPCKKIGYEEYVEVIPLTGVQKGLILKAELTHESCRVLTKEQYEEEVKNLTVEHLAHYGLGATNYTGSDPEVFVRDQSGEIVPAWEFLPSKKVRKDTFWDGLQAEFTITPSHCHAYVVDYVRAGLQRVLNAARWKFPEATLCMECAVRMPKRQKSWKPEHLALGCDPSRNAYGVAPLDVDAETLPWRFAGFHIHQQQSAQPAEVIERTVKAMDGIAGVVMTSTLQGLENPIRRQYYGKAGEYRLPKHGLEWRVLGSGVMYHPALTGFALDITRAAWKVGQVGMGGLWKANDDEVQEAINSYDVDLCKKILSRNKEALGIILQQMYNQWGGSTSIGFYSKVNSVINKGWKEFAETTPQAVMQAWALPNAYWSTHSEGPSCQFNKFVRKIK